MTAGPAIILSAKDRRMLLELTDSLPGSYKDTVLFSLWCRRLVDQGGCHSDNRRWS
jgi:hypothetical protein